jgi:ornithine cyclodeaminase/alanine dehydrogenase-like protein (mu-crystallin family)
VAATRINSDFHRFYEVDGKLRRTKVAAAPGGDSGRRRYVGLVLLFSTETTEPLCILPDGMMQPMRVGATSALGVKYLARAETPVVALIGAGHQALGQALGVTTVRPVKELRVYSPTGQNRTRFANELRKRHGINAVPVHSLAAAVDGADIVLCGTNSRAAVAKAEWLRPGLHLGAINPFELDAATVNACDLAACHVRDCDPVYTGTHGIAHPETSGATQNLAVDANFAEMPTLADIVAGNASGRTSDDQTSCFVNTVGMGYQFAAIGYLIYRKAKAARIGREVPTDWFTQDEVS